MQIPLPPPDEFLAGFAETGRVYDGRIFSCWRDFGQAMRFIIEIQGNSQVIFSVDAQTMGVIFDPQSNKEFPVKGVCFDKDRERPWNSSDCIATSKKGKVPVSCHASSKTRKRSKRRKAMSSKDISESVFEAFHLMWGNFPAEVTLVRKSREVVAVNKALQASGRLKPGMFCYKEGSANDHKGCKANKALEGGQAEYVQFMAGEHPAVAFWVPLVGSDDLFVHFMVDTGSFK